MTGNWFASKSNDGGNNWSLVDPFTQFPSAAGGFCCDQVVIYEPSRDIWIWILQYVRSGGSNIFRVAVCRGATFGSWYWWDFTPTALNARGRTCGSTTRTQRPAATISTSPSTPSAPGLLVTSIRIQVAVEYSARRHEPWLPMVVHDDSRLAAPHSGGAKLHVLREPQWGTATADLWLARRIELDRHDRRHRRTLECRAILRARPRRGGLADQDDSRITGAWVSGTRAGFLWTAAARTGRPMPYVKGARRGHRHAGFGRGA